MSTANRSFIKTPIAESKMQSSKAFTETRRSLN
jgi:hypothetical protein